MRCYKLIKRSKVIASLSFDVDHYSGLMGLLSTTTSTKKKSTLLDRKESKYVQLNLNFLSRIKFLNQFYRS